MQNSTPTNVTRYTRASEEIVHLKKSYFKKGMPSCIEYASRSRGPTHVHEHLRHHGVHENGSTVRSVVVCMRDEVIVLAAAIAQPFLTLHVLVLPQDRLTYLQWIMRVSSKCTVKQRGQVPSDSSASHELTAAFPHRPSNTYYTRGLTDMSVFQSHVVAPFLRHHWEIGWTHEGSPAES